jgi:hypothetical protein
MPAAALSAPPPDVQALLEGLGVARAQSVYFDAQQRLALQAAQQQWPALWRLAFAAS